MIGDPCYGLEDKYANTLLTYQPYRQLSPATESSNFRAAKMQNMTWPNYLDDFS